MVVLNSIVRIVSMIVTMFAGSSLVIDSVKTNSNADDDGNNRERIEERTQDGRYATEHQCQECLGANAEQQLGEYKKQQLAHE